VSQDAFAMLHFGRLRGGIDPACQI
jgi:hypothetical protein